MLMMQRPKSSQGHKNVSERLYEQKKQYEQNALNRQKEHIDNELGNLRQP